MARSIRRVAVAISILAGSVGCATNAPDEILAIADRYQDVVELPAPDLAGSVPFEQVLADRRSGREFDDAELPVEVIGQLLWAGQGVTGDRGYRTAPSAGARYPLELYVVTGDRLWHYLPDGHRAEWRDDTTTLASLANAAFGQDAAGAAPAVIVVTGVEERTAVEYGALAHDFVQREAGHAVQNILLQATALDLVAVPMGGFDPAAVATQLALPPAEEVLYLVPVGGQPGR